MSKITLHVAPGVEHAARQRYGMTHRIVIEHNNQNARGVFTSVGGVPRVEPNPLYGMFEVCVDPELAPWAWRVDPHPDLADDSKLTGVWPHDIEP